MLRSVLVLSLFAWKSKGDSGQRDPASGLFGHRWAGRGEKRKPSLEMKGQLVLSPFCLSAITQPVLHGVAQIHPDKQRGRARATHWLIRKAIQPRIPHPGNSQQNGNLGRAQREDGDFIYAAGEREREREMFFQVH